MRGETLTLPVPLIELGDAELRKSNTLITVSELQEPGGANGISKGARGVGASPTQKRSFWGILFNDLFQPFPHGPPHLMTSRWLQTAFQFAQPAVAATQRLGRPAFIAVVRRHRLGHNVPLDPGQEFVE